MVLYLQDLGLENSYIIDATVYFVLISTLILPFLIYKEFSKTALIISIILAVLQILSLYKNIQNAY